MHLEPWGPGDLPLLQRLVGEPAMMEHLGGPESPEKIRDRQARYERAPAAFKIVTDAGEGAGWVGFWPHEWHGEEVFEVGWAVAPEFQGQGLASAGTAAAIDVARADGSCSRVHAFPSVDNAASNAVCRRLGFTLVGAIDMEYPPGNPMRCNDWRLDL